MPGFLVLGSQSGVFQCPNLVPIAHNAAGGEQAGGDRLLTRIQEMQDDVCSLI